MDLQPGAHATVRKDGADIVGVYEVPQDGPLIVRDLPPGAYVADDGCGNTHRFHVSAVEEVAVVGGRSVPRDEVLPDARAVPGEPGTRLVQSEGLEVVHEPGSQAAQAVRDAVAELPEEEQRLHGLPVSAPAPYNKR